MPLHGLPFVSSSKRWIHVSSPVTMVDKKLSSSASQRASNSEQMIFLCFLCSSVRLRGTHRAHTFEYPNRLMILSTLPLPIPSIAASYLVVILRFFRIWLSARCIVAGVTAVGGWPERGRLDTLPCPCSDDANRFAQRLTMFLSTAMSP
jgi:hypothetical protein